LNNTNSNNSKSAERQAGNVFDTLLLACRSALFLFLFLFLLLL